MTGRSRFYDAHFHMRNTARYKYIVRLNDTISVHVHQAKVNGSRLKLKYDDGHIKEWRSFLLWDKCGDQSDNDRIPEINSRDPNSPCVKLRYPNEKKNVLLSKDENLKTQWQ